MSDSTAPRSTRVLSLRARGGGFMGGPSRVAGSAHVFEQRARSLLTDVRESPSLGVSQVAASTTGVMTRCNRKTTEAGSQSCRAHPNHRPHSSRAISSACIALIALRNTSRANVQFPAAVSLLPVSPVVAGFPTTAPVRAVVDLCFFRSDMSTLRVRRLCGASGPKAPTEGASEVGGSGIRAYPRGVFLSLSASLRSSFVPVHSVIQLVIPLNLSKEAPLDQMHLPLLCRLDAPSVVSPNLIDACKSYRDAVKLCWELRRIRNMTQQRLAEEAGLYAPHVTCYLRDSNRQRDLPGAAVRAFQWACGNTAISQWLNRGVRLAVVEEMSFLRSCPA